MTNTADAKTKHIIIYIIALFCMLIAQTIETLAMTIMIKTVPFCRPGDKLKFGPGLMYRGYWPPKYFDYFERAPRPKRNRIAGRGEGRNLSF